MNRLDNVLEAWNILLTIPSSVDPNDQLLIKIVNPLWNTFFQSNFIVQKNSETALADAGDVTLKRAFMTLPVKNIVGTDVLPDTGELPVLMESWSATGADFGSGKLLRLFTNDSILATFASKFVLSTVNGEPTSGGAAVNAIPVAAADTDDTLPPDPQIATGGSGGIPATSTSPKCR